MELIRSVRFCGRFGFIFIFLFLFSCSAPDQSSPDGTLKLFIAQRFNDASDADLMKFFTNDFKLKMQVEIKESANGEENPIPPAEIEFKKKFLKKDFEISKQTCTKPELCIIRYILSYYSLGDKPNQKQFLTETKKVAILKKVDGFWYIDDVEHLKTYHESLEQIEIKSSAP
ncbi:MAG: hypothetical protein QE271_06855 [Bacteriovoracaceae bacterium]|nr:hypothetical protein [Bacteriovoracaceae bacterium]